MKKIVKLFALIGSFVVCTVCAVAGLNPVEAKAQTPEIQTHGASVRLEDPAGIRFLSSVSAEYMEGYEIGTLIMPKILLGSNALNHNDDVADDIDLDYTLVEQTQWSNKAVAVQDPEDYDETRGYFNAVLTKIPEADYGTVLVARAYARKLNDGVYTYTYGDPVERSIAQVAAMAMQDGETDDQLSFYIEMALGDNVPTMAKQMYVGQGETTLNVTGTNGYAITWTSSNEDVATVDKKGVLTATANGNATITGNLGPYTVEANVQVGNALEGEKIVSINEAVSGGYFVNSSNATVSYTDMTTVFGAGVAEVKTPDWIHSTAKFTKNMDLTWYSKISFKIYVSAQQYDTYLKIFRVKNGNHLVDVTLSNTAKNGEWVDVEIDIEQSGFTNLNELYIRHCDHAGDDTDGKNGQNPGYYILISDIYAVEKEKMDLLLDMKTAVANQTFKSATDKGVVSYSEEYDMAKITCVTDIQCAGGVYTEDISLEGYTYIQFRVFRPAEVTGGYYLRILKESTKLNTADSIVSKTPGVWYTYRLKVSDLKNSTNSSYTDGKENLWKLFIQFGTNTSTANVNGKYILISDIYGIK